MGFIRILVFCSLVALGLFQYNAISDGLEAWLNLHWIIAAPVSFILGFFPLIGSIVGMFGVVEVWGWSWTKAILFFFGAHAIVIFLSFLSNIFDDQ